MNEIRLIDANALKEKMMKAFGCENATKYGNKNAEQQANSYSTLMLYEISDIVEDCIDNAPTVKIGKDNGSCQYCKYQNKKADEEPCNKCKHSHEDRFEWEDEKSG